MSEIVPENVPIAFLADVLGVSDRQARNALANARVAPVERGRWPLRAALRALFIAAKRRDEPNELVAARARAVRAQARERELKIAREEHRLTETDALAEILQIVMSAIVEELDGLPARVTRDMPLRRKIDEEIRAARGRMVATIAEADARIKGNREEGTEQDD